MFPSFDPRILLKVIHLHSDAIGDVDHLLVTLLGHLPHGAFDFLILEDRINAERDILVLSLRSQEDPILDLFKVAISSVLQYVKDNLRIVEDGDI